MNSQTAFALPLLQPELACPTGLKTWNGSNPALRYAVYRNNVTVSLIDALADTFPVVQQLVGEDFFRAMARLFAQAHPPQSRIMAFFGQGFADFIAGFAPAASVPYLADIARLEMAYVQTYHAADAHALDGAQLQAWLADPMELEHHTLALHPSVQLICSPYAIVSIWAAHQTDADPQVPDADVPQNAWMFRSGQSVHVQTIADGIADFLAALLRGVTLLDAADDATANDSAFNLPGALALLLRWQLLIDRHTGDTRHDPSH
ncbi:MAG: DNA-binding domain-containing protein [Rhodoferax sp.]|nr:DNA-binding domain-containing protein [Rhodoferax sp.]